VSGRARLAERLDSFDVRPVADCANCDVCGTQAATAHSGGPVESASPRFAKPALLLSSKSPDDRTAHSRGHTSLLPLPPLSWERTCTAQGRTVSSVYLNMLMW